MEMHQRRRDIVALALADGSNSAVWLNIGKLVTPIYSTGNS